MPVDEAFIARNRQPATRTVEVVTTRTEAAVTLNDLWADLTEWDPPTAAEFDPTHPQLQKWATAVLSELPAGSDRLDAIKLLCRGMQAAVARRGPNYYAPAWDPKGREIYDEAHQGPDPEPAPEVEPVPEPAGAPTP